jgi:hypothetical protein
LRFLKFVGGIQPDSTSCLTELLLEKSLQWLHFCSQDSIIDPSDAQEVKRVRKIAHHLLFSTRTLVSWLFTWWSST